LEHYLSSVLIFGARHHHALENLLARGEARLRNNRRLHRSLQLGATQTWTPSASGLIVKSSALPLNSEKFSQWLDYIVRGLVYFEFDKALGADSMVDTHTVRAVGGEAFFRRYLNLNAAARSQRNIGNGAFIYEGAQGIGDRRVSVWLITIFGGLLLGDRGKPCETKIGALTGPREIADRVALRQKWIEGRAAFP
jgi:hypothetical protein